MLVLPKMPSSDTPLCSAESRPFDRPVVFANICDIIDARLDALHQERAEVAVQRADEVFLPQPEAGADDDRFLADAGVDAAADLALLDEDAEALVERANQLQPVEHLEQLFGRELELGAFDRRHRRRSRIG